MKITFDGKGDARFTRQAGEFHRRNATAWANDSTGEDLAGQIDPDFTLGPAALSVSAASTVYLHPGRRVCP